MLARGTIPSSDWLSVSHIRDYAIESGHLNSESGPRAGFVIFRTAIQRKRPTGNKPVARRETDHNLPTTRDRLLTDDLKR